MKVEMIRLQDDWAIIVRKLV